jgi:Rieske 2Fe-2S family protein
MLPMQPWLLWLVVLVVLQRLQWLLFLWERAMPAIAALIQVCTGTRGGQRARIAGMARSHGKPPTMTLLSRTLATPPTSYYLDEAHFRRELAAIWYREWICVGRAAEWVEPGDYRVVTIGTQRLIVLRDESSALRAFHNTCRHRGSELCQQEAGRLATRRIVCPYHAWSYALDGALLNTPRRVPTADFDPARYGLYEVALQCWRGFVFLNLDPAPREPLEAILAEDAAAVASWPLETLRLAQREVHEVACNWKIFWENFLECTHCPGVHSELSRLVPMYGRGMLRADDDPAWQGAADAHMEPQLAQGRQTWSRDGTLCAPPIAGVDPAAIETGMRFATGIPSMFVVVHRDYVRTLRIRVLAVDRIELTVEWLVDAAVDPAKLDLERLTEFGRMVVMEDARICEVAQRGLGSLRHEAGVLMPQEYDVHAFHDWVASRMNR